MTHWTFTGSRLFKTSRGVIFTANTQGVLVATYYDPDAIINNPLPEKDDDTVYYANENALPPRLTPVKIIFSAQLLDSANQH